MAASVGVVKDWTSLQLALQRLVTDINAGLQWLGPVELDPLRLANGQVWLRTDVPSLRLRAADRTYEIALTEV